MAQLAMNNAVSASTKTSPFYANHGRHPNLFERTLPCNIKTQKALLAAEELKKVHQELQKHIKEAQDKSISYVNKKRKMAPQLKRGDKVYLLTTNLSTLRPSKKLDHVKVGPFLISKVLGPVNYKLDLPPDAKVHPNFNIKYLEPADPDTPLQTTFHYEPQEEDIFTVEKILKHRQVSNKKEYLIKWKGYPHADNTWEPEEHLLNCRQELRRYYRSLGKSRPQ
jgi:hypothetical protein